MWYYLFRKKESSMPKNTNEETNEEMVAVIKNHTERISRLSQRISDISDEITLLKNDLNGFKKGVARDMRNILDVINNNEK